MARVAAAVGPAVQVLQRVRGGAAVALVSDAGVPAVSDPGAKLVAAAVAAGLPVVPVPGEAEHLPCASARSLSVAGQAQPRHKQLHLHADDACAAVLALAISRGERSMLPAGPSAVLAALVASGLSCEAFQSVGFLPAKPGQRQKQLQQLAGMAVVTLCIRVPL